MIGTQGFSEELKGMMAGASGMESIFGALDGMSNDLTNFNLEELFANETSGILNYNLWKETVNLQTHFNNQVKKDWQINPQVDYWMAILDETTEILNSRNWKWWKDSNNFGVIDWDNVKVEMVDLFCFILSLSIKEKNVDLFYSSLLTHENLQAEYPAPKITSENFFESIWSKLMMAIFLKATPLMITNWVELWYQLGGDAKSLLMDYRIKMALNYIRQEFGYGATNTYSKNWPSVQNKNIYIEDNKVAWGLVGDLELNENTLKNVQNILRKYYATYVAK